MRKDKGFTLIEILVALMIFAIMGVLAARSLHSVIRIHARLKTDNAETMQLMMAMTLIRRDITEAIDRPVMTSAGTPSPGFVADESSITFTRTGLLNPLSQARQSNMQRIGYELEGDHLVRLSWGVLDATKETQPAKQVLLTGVNSIQWQCISSNGDKTFTWPMPQKQDDPNQKPIDPMPTVVLMVMKTKGQGVLEGVFPIPGRGVDVKKLSADQSAPQALP